MSDETTKGLMEHLGLLNKKLIEDLVEEESHELPKELTIEIPINEYDLSLFESIVHDDTSFEWIFNNKNTTVHCVFRQANENGE